MEGQTGAIVAPVFLREGAHTWVRPYRTGDVDLEGVVGRATGIAGATDAKASGGNPSYRRGSSGGGEPDISTAGTGEDMRLADILQEAEWMGT